MWIAGAPDAGRLWWQSCYRNLGDSFPRCIEGPLRCQEGRVLMGSERSDNAIHLLQLHFGIYPPCHHWQLTGKVICASSSMIYTLLKTIMSSNISEYLVFLHLICNSASVAYPLSMLHVNRSTLEMLLDHFCLILGCSTTRNTITRLEPVNTPASFGSWPLPRMVLTLPTRLASSVSIHAPSHLNNLELLL